MGRFLAPLDLGVVLGAGGGGTTSEFGTAAEAAAEGGASTAGSAASSLFSGSCGSYILSRGSFFSKSTLSSGWTLARGAGL